MCLTDFTLRVTEALVCYSESVTRVATENTARGRSQIFYHQNFFRNIKY